MTDYRSIEIDANTPDLKTVKAQLGKDDRLVRLLEHRQHGELIRLVKIDARFQFQRLIHDYRGRPRWEGTSWLHPDMVETLRSIN